MNDKQGTSMYDVRSTMYETPIAGNDLCAGQSYTVHRTSYNVLLRVSYLILIAALFCFIGISNSSCKVYKFHDNSFPDSIKTFKINIFENRATYINPTLSPRLADKLRQKITSQTRISQVNNAESADWLISGTINNYSFTTSGITSSATTGRQESTNRLTVGVHITILDQKANTNKEYDVSKSFEFSASQSIQQAEASLGDQIIRDVTDDIFNRIFSTW